MWSCRPQTQNNFIINWSTFEKSNFQRDCLVTTKYYKLDTVFIHLFPPFFCGVQVFGDLISPTVPYKTLLCSVGDDCKAVVQCALEKYNISHACKAEDFTLVVRTQSKHANVLSNGVRSHEQRLVEDQELPLVLLRELQSDSNDVTFHLVERKDARNGAHNIRPRVQSPEEDLIGRSLQQLPWHTDPQPVRTDLRVGARAATEPSSPRLGNQRRLVSSTQGKSTYN